MQGNGDSALTSFVGIYNSAKEKWHTSGANEAVGRMSASIPDSTKMYVGSLFKREHLRSIGVFFGIGEERPFYVEKTPSLLVERLRHNVSFFYLNYALLTALMFCLTLLINPQAIIGMGLLALAWMWVIRSSQSGTLRIQNVAIPQKTATAGMGIFTIFILIWLLSGIFWWALFCSGFFAGVHALLRDASMHKDMEDAIQMEGDLNLGESSSFLNPARVEQV